MPMMKLKWNLEMEEETETLQSKSRRQRSSQREEATEEMVRKIRTKNLQEAQ